MNKKDRKKISTVLRLGFVSIVASASLATSSLSLDFNQGNFTDSIKPNITISNDISNSTSINEEQEIISLYRDADSDAYSFLLELNKEYKNLQVKNFTKDEIKELKKLNTQFSKVILNLEKLYTSRFVTKEISELQEELISKLYIVKSMTQRIAIPKKFRKEIIKHVEKEEFYTKGMELRTMYLDIDKRCQV